VKHECNEHEIEMKDIPEWIGIKEKINMEPRNYPIRVYEGPNVPI